MMHRLSTVGLVVLLASGCITGKERPGDAKVITFPDFTVDGGPVHDGSADSGDDARWPDSTVDALGADGAVDTRSPDSTVDMLSPDSTVDTLSPDSTVDMLSPDSTVDAFSPDTIPPPCASVADHDTVMLLNFEGMGSTVTDVTGDHDGTIVGSGIGRVAGMTGCGRALAFSGAADEYVEVPDSAAWQLANGSIDFWFSPTSRPTTRAGIIGRDDENVSDGQLSIYQICNGSVVARFEDSGARRSICTEPLENDTWHHIGVNFGSGGFEIYLDGQLSKRTGSVWCDGRRYECDETTTQGLSGDANPWVIGAGCSNSQAGSAEPVDFPLHGKLDSVRISSARRTF